MKSKRQVRCASACAAGLAAVFVSLFSAAGTAHATTITITGSYTVSYTPIAGNSPSITDRLGTWVSGVRDFTETLTIGGPATTPVNFITVTPAGSCGSTCVKGPNEGTTSHPLFYYTASGTVGVAFSFSNITVLGGSTLTDTGLYQAKYGGSPLSPCALASGSGDSDCVTWSHHSASSTGGHDTLAVNFQQGSILGTLDIILNDAEDWAITPTISFQALASGGGNQTTPLPGALPLFGGVLGGGLFFSKWRRKRKDGAAA